MRRKLLLVMVLGIALAWTGEASARPFFGGRAMPYAAARPYFGGRAMPYAAGRMQPAPYYHSPYYRSARFQSFGGFKGRPDRYSPRDRRVNKFQRPSTLTIGTGVTVVPLVD